MLNSATVRIFKWLSILTSLMMCWCCTLSRFFLRLSRRWASLYFIWFIYEISIEGGSTAAINWLLYEVHSWVMHAVVRMQLNCTWSEAVPTAHNMQYRKNTRPFCNIWGASRIMSIPLSDMLPVTPDKLNCRAQGRWAKCLHFLYSLLTGLIATWLILMSSTSQESSFSSCSKNSLVSRNPLCSGSDSHSFSKTSILSISSCWLCFPAYGCCHTGPSALSGSNFNDVSATSILIQLPLSSNSNCRTSRMRLLPWDRVFWSKCIQNIFRISETFHYRCMRLQEEFIRILNPYDWKFKW